MFLLQKRGGRERFIPVTLGTLAAYYLRLVWKTSRFELEPANIYEKVEPDLPAILAMWHGQHFMAPFIKREAHRVKVLVSRHRDGEINAIAAQRLGIATIRGSGGRFDRKGGVGAFREMLDALARRGARHRDAGARIRATDLPHRGGHEPPHRARQLGSLRDQPAVQSRRD